MTALRSWLHSRPNQFWLLAAAAVYIPLVFLACKRGLDIFHFLPLVLIGALYFISNFNHLWLLMVFLVPLSAELDGIMPGSARINLPTDLLCLTITGLMVLKITTGGIRDTLSLRHPLVLIMGVFVLWYLFTSAFSTMPVVSFKRTAAYSWTLGAFLIFPALLFRNDRYIRYFLIALGIGYILSYTLIIGKYVIFGGNLFSLRFNPTPFFVDHTVFGGFTSMMIPFYVVMFLERRESGVMRAFCFITATYLLIGLIMSASRGGWVSLASSGLFFAIVYLRELIQKNLLLTIVLSLTLLVAGILIITSLPKKNTNVSRKGYKEHLSSVTNFKTDASNAERINRWMTAIHMWQVHPMTGFGPGTYTDKYGPYQSTQYMTNVSTMKADNGNAHQEFLLALSEMGFVGMILTALMFLMALWYGLGGYFRSQDPLRKSFYLGASLGIFCYFVHAFVNNFLDQDKVGGPFYAFMAMIVAMDATDWEHRQLPETRE